MDESAAQHRRRHTSQQGEGNTQRCPTFSISFWDQMFRPGWIENYLSGSPSWFRAAADANEAADWAPRAPLRLYVGDDDVDIHPDDARLASERFSDRGGNAELVALGHFDHTAVLFEAVPPVLQWFREIAETQLIDQPLTP